jgi:hypothetical protein
MPVIHLSRREVNYYLHEGTTKTGKPRYWFSTKDDGDLVEEIPEGFEVYENPDAQVFLRKIQTQVIFPLEVAMVEKGLKRYASGEHCLVDVQKKDIVIYHADEEKRLLEVLGVREMPASLLRYTKVMRFTLVDTKDRTFQAQRWCFRGSVDDWIDLWMGGGQGSLADLIAQYGPHIGKESFFELM